MDSVNHQSGRRDEIHFTCPIFGPHIPDRYCNFSQSHTASPSRRFIFFSSFPQDLSAFFVAKARTARSVLSSYGIKWGFQCEVDRVQQKGDSRTHIEFFASDSFVLGPTFAFPGHWRMIMAPAGGFSVTPGHYNAQYDYEFRQRRERVSYAEVRIMPGKSYIKSSERGRGISNYFSSINFRLKPTAAESRDGSTTRTRASHNHRENLDAMLLILKSIK